MVVLRESDEWNSPIIGMEPLPTGGDVDRRRVIFKDALGKDPQTQDYTGLIMEAKDALKEISRAEGNLTLAEMGLKRELEKLGKID